MSHFEERSGVVACETDWGRWYQTLEDVNIEINLVPGTKGRDIKVDISNRRIKCQVKALELLKGRLFDCVIQDESTWTIEDQKLLRILLVKSRKSEYWSSLLEDGQFQPDPNTLLQMRQKIDLERFQIEHPGLDFSDAKLDKQYTDLIQPPTTHNLMGATALPLSSGENKTDDEKLLECEARLGAGAVVVLPPEHPPPPFRTSDSSRTFVEDRLLATDDSLIAAAGALNAVAAAATDDSLIAASGTMNVAAAAVTDDSLIAATGTMDTVIAAATDDSLIAAAGTINTVSASDNSLLAADVGALLLDDTDVTDDMKTESENAVQPVVTDDMKNEENESLETDEQKSRM